LPSERNVSYKYAVKEYTTLKSYKKSGSVEVSHIRNLKSLEVLRIFQECRFTSFL